MITDVKFWEKCSGNRISISTLIDYLSTHSQLKVINTGPSPVDIEQQLSNRITAEFFVLEKTTYLSSVGYGRKLKLYLKNKNFDVVIIEYLHSSYFLKYLFDNPIIILDVHDLISERAEDFKRFNYEGALFEISKEREEQILKVYNYVMAIYEPDYKKQHLLLVRKEHYYARTQHILAGTM